MIKTIEESPLFPISHPRSIAIYGASNRFAAMGSSHLQSLLSLGFKGPIYPIHPKETEILGLRAYRNPHDLPEVPDLVLLVLPTRVVPEILDECGKSGIRRAIVVSGGFREVGGEGIDLENRLKEVAAAHHIRFLGPNCIGVVNPHLDLNTTFFPFDGTPGYVGIASQSGSFVTQMFKFLGRNHLGFSTAFSVGNEADVDIVDAMEYLGACPFTKVIALYIEGIRRGREFMQMARAIVPKKPIVAFFAGGSEAGKRASFSHTGALAGSEAVVDGAFRQSGVIRAGSITELFDFCWVLATQPPPSGNRVVILTHSGGPGAAAADACDRQGLHLPALSPDTGQRLAPFMPHTGSIANPVDMTFYKDSLTYFHEVPEVLLMDKNVDMLLPYLLLPPHIVRQGLGPGTLTEEEILQKSEVILDAQVRSVESLGRAHRKPVIGFTFSDAGDPFIRKLLEKGIPVFPEPERAGRALWALVEYSRARRRMGGGEDPGTEA